MEVADHSHVYFVIFVDGVFAFLDPLDKVFLAHHVLLPRLKETLRNSELHEGLVEKDAGEEAELVIADVAGLVVLVQEEGDPLRGGVAGFGRLEGVLAEEGQDLGAVPEVDIEFLSY